MIFPQKNYLILVHRIVSCQDRFLPNIISILHFFVKPMAVISSGKRLSSSMMVLNVGIEMGDYKFLASPIVLGNSDIDLILGMDWLSKHKA